ncbi:MAG: nitrous oxide-stimulated promoter family protein [SAR324 cluster bacterium]|nr:nitrous oxide-stimulated promoter family protein [SAR324 cluster bacterium]
MNQTDTAPETISQTRRIRREIKTTVVMINLYCQKQHATKALCLDCTDLLNYTMRRIDKCRFSINKPTCANCTVHCFKPFYREKIRQIMAFSGPRMSYRHPILTLFHFMDKFRKPVK